MWISDRPLRRLPASLADPHQLEAAARRLLPGYGGARSSSAPEAHAREVGEVLAADGLPGECPCVHVSAAESPGLRRAYRRASSRLGMPVFAVFLSPHNALSICLLPWVPKTSHPQPRATNQPLHGHAFNRAPAPALSHLGTHQLTSAPLSGPSCGCWRRRIWTAGWRASRRARRRTCRCWSGRRRRRRPARTAHWVRTRVLSVLCMGFREVGM